MSFVLMAMGFITVIVCPCILAVFCDRDGRFVRGGNPAKAPAIKQRDSR
jgi:hypothetical protein